MTKWPAVLCWLAAGCVSTGALAQQWTVYAPPERDFQVVFPQPPSRASQAEGAVQFSAAAENMEYFVYRRDPRLQPVGNPARDIQQRLQRGDGDEQRVQRMSEDEGDPGTAEYIFRIGSKITIHRLFVAPRRYYELVVRSSREDHADARRAARDFFGTFQFAGAGAARLTATPGLAPDMLCKDRSNAFSRTFCEYRTCFQSGYEKHPYCMKLLGRQ